MFRELSWYSENYTHTNTLFISLFPARVMHRYMSYELNEIEFHKAKISLTVAIKNILFATYEKL